MSEIIELSVTNGQPTTTSLAIAEHFGKQHAHVLRDIEKLAAQNEGDQSNFGGVSPKSEFGTFIDLNFQGGAYKGGNGELRPMYHITKDGFMFLAMGFTGKEAAQWKVKFIAAFNAMERQLLENAAAQQVPQPSAQLFLSHTADIIVAADRTFRAGMRTGRQAGLTTAQSIRRANQLAYLKTGINMLEELKATDHLEDLEKKEAIKTDDLDEFFAAFEGGELPGGGCVPMLSTQLHRIYVYWCARNNVDALKPPKFVQALKELGLFRHVRKRYVDPSGGMFGPVSFLIPTGEIHIPEKMPEREWLGQCVEDVETAITNSGA